MTFYLDASQCKEVQDFKILTLNLSCLLFMSTFQVNCILFMSSVLASKEVTLDGSEKETRGFKIIIGLLNICIENGVSKISSINFWISKDTYMKNNTLILYQGSNICKYIHT